MRRFGFALVLSGFALATGCAHFGQAKLPAKTAFFVTTGDLATKDYTPIALVESQQTMCTPCASLESSYEKLEASMAETMVERAKALGANGIINVHYSVMPMMGVSMVRIQGLAIKM